MATVTLSIPTLQKAIKLAEQIEQLEREFQQVIRGEALERGANPGRIVSAATRKRIGAGQRLAWESSKPLADRAPAHATKKRKPFSAETRAKMAAAQAARWAKKNGASAGPATAVALEENGGSNAGKGKRVLSPKARARIVAAQKARWAKAKGASAGPATAIVVAAEKGGKATKRVAKAPKPEKKKSLISKEVLSRMAAKAKELKGGAKKKNDSTAETSVPAQA